MSDSKASSNNRRSKRGKDQRSGGSQDNSRGITSAAQKGPKTGTNKSSPIPELTILQLNTGEFQQWKDALLLYLTRVYKAHGRYLILTGKKLVPELPTPAPMIGISESMTQDAYNAAEAQNDFARARNKIMANQYEKLLQTIDEDMIAIYAVIWGQLSDASQAKLRTTILNFSEIEAQAKAVELWKAVSEIHQASITGCSELDKENARSRYQRLSCNSNETVAAFRIRFDAAIAGLKAVNLEEPSAQDQATRFLTALDDQRFSTFKATLYNNAQLNISVLPKTLAEMVHMATEFKVAVSNPSGGGGGAVFVTQAANLRGRNPHAKSDNNGNSHSSGSNQQKKSDKKSGGKNSKDKKSEDSKSGEKKKLACDYCGGEHLVRECSVMLAAAAQYKAGIAKLVNVASNADAKPMFTIKHVAFSIAPGGRDCDVLLDNQATISIFRSPKLVRNIRKANPDEVTTVLGINGDASLILDQIAETECFGEVFYHPKASANVLSLGQVEERFTVTYETGVSFTVVTDDYRTFVFSKSVVPGTNGGCLYTCCFAPWRAHALVSTVPANEAGHTKAEVERAKLAKRVFELLGFPSVAKIMEIIKTGAIVNMPITAADVRLALEIYGPDVAMLMGKNKQRKSKAIRDETIPDAIVETKQRLHADIMFVDRDPYLITVSKPMHLIVSTHLGGSRSVPGMRKAIHEQLALYSGRNFQVDMVFSDCEGAIVALISDLHSAGVQVNLATPGQHVPVVENAIKVIKERIRCNLVTLPFRMPAKFMKWLVPYVIGRINIVPSRSSADCTSPREKFLGRRTDFKRDTRISFLQSVLVPVTSHEQSNSVHQSRMMHALSLHPTGNQQGSVLFYNLSTGDTLTREHWEEIPMTQQVLDHLNGMDPSPSVANNFDPILAIGQVDKALPAVSNGDNPFSSDPEPQDSVADDDSSPLDHSPGDEGAVVVGDSVIFDQGNTQAALDPNFEYWSTESEDYWPADPSGYWPDPSETQRKASVAEDKYAYKLSHMPLGASPKQVFNIMLTRAIKTYGPAAFHAVFAEMGQMLSKGVFQGLDPKTLTVEQRRSVIRSSLFLKEKFNALGEFLKLKARLVAGGDCQDRALYEESATSSPTASLGAVMMVLGIAAKEHRHVFSVDIGGAYLNADMKEEVLMRLEPKLAAILCGLDSNYLKLLEPRGSLVVKLKKALYGCIESGKLWYDKLVSILHKIGFIQNPHERCVFNLTKNGTQITVAVYVDDLLFTCSSLELLNEICDKSLPEHLDEVKVTKGLVHSFLGMTLDLSTKGKVSITMPSYICDTLDEYGVTGTATTPALDNLFDIRESPPLSPDNAKKFHSWVAKLLYLPKRCRPDISVSVAFLSTRVQAPTEDDMVKLDRVMKYLNGTRDLGICIQPDPDAPLEPRAYVDASYGVHADAKSHTGCVITLGSGPVYVKSAKQKIVSKSSTEAELVGLSDSLGQIIWSRDFLIAQGYDLGATTVYQDNLSTIALAENGQSNSERSRHINIRYFFIKDRIAGGEVGLEHMPTADMVADILTKPLQGALFRALRDKLMNWHY